MKRFEVVLILELNDSRCWKNVDKNFVWSMMHEKVEDFGYVESVEEILPEEILQSSNTEI